MIPAIVPIEPTAPESPAQKLYVVHDPRVGQRNARYEIRVDPEFEALIPSLQPGEFAQLEADIREHGPHDEIIVWSNSPNDSDVVLLDGHHRLAIFAKLQAEAKAAGAARPKIYAPIRVLYRSATAGTHVDSTSDEEIHNRAEAILWIEQNQIGRRNLTEDQKAVIWDDIREQRSRVASQEGAAKARAARTDSVKLTETAQDPTQDPAQDPNGPRLSDEMTDKSSEAQDPTQDPTPVPTKRDTRKEVAKESGVPERKLRAVAALKKVSPS